MIDVFLVDDHEVVRRGLRELLDGEAQIQVVGEASNYAHAVARIPALRPHVAVVDVRLPDGNGIDLCGEMRSEVPEMRCLILTSYEDDRAMLSAIMAGASGYVMKDIKGLDLTRAIREIGEGKSLLDNRSTAALVRKLRNEESEKSGPIKQLTEQEKVLLGLLGEGLTNRQIAGRMFLAEKTVKNYVSRLLGKLGVERRTQAAILAIKLQPDLPRP